MTSFFAITALGFLLGMRHATDPDHVIAVTTIVTRYRDARSAAVIGLAWGLGHSLTVLVVGAGIILFNWMIPARLGLTMELAVGLMLIVLGLMNLTGVLPWVTQRLTMARKNPEELHSHAHIHGDYVHTHIHGHDPDLHPHAPEQTPMGWLDGRLGGLSLYQLLRPLVVGVVHGLAGSAAVALLVLATIRNPSWSIVYLLVFGLGTMLGMMLITVVIALPLVSSPKSFSRVQGGLRVASGVVSLGFGLFLAYQIGVVDGLFTGQPHWAPR